MGNSTDQDHFVYTVKGVLARDTFHRKISLFRLPGARSKKKKMRLLLFDWRGEKNTPACNNYRPMWVN